MLRPISSRSNPLVRQVRALRQRKARQETGLFLVEGIHHVGEAVEAGWQIESLLYAPDLLTSGFARQLVDEQSRRGLRVATITSKLFIDLANKDNPQGILAVVRQRQLTFEHITAEDFHFGAAIVSPQDPGNVGTILRTLDAAGADGLFLLDPLTGAGSGVELYHPTVVRASMGTLFWIPVVQASFDEFVQWAHHNGCRIIGSSAHASTDYRKMNPANGPTVLLLGSEQKGLTPEQLAACELVVSLPMRGRASSLNLAVATGILLYALMGGK